MKIIVDLSDPVFYAGLEELMEGLGEVEGTDPQEADRQVKKLLSEAFWQDVLGEENAFSLTKSGETVLEAFLNSLAPALTRGAENCLASLLQRAKSQAESRREAI